MLTTLKEVLNPARTNRYSVPAFDCTEDVMVRAILETAEAKQAPVILMCLDIDLVSNSGNGMAYLSGLIRAVAPHHQIRWYCIWTTRLKWLRFKGHSIPALRP